MFWIKSVSDFFCLALLFLETWRLEAIAVFFQNPCWRQYIVKPFFFFLNHQSEMKSCQVRTSVLVFSDEDKAVIEHYVQNGYTAYKIWKENPEKNWDRMSVQRLVKRYKQYGTMKRQKGSREWECRRRIDLLTRRSTRYAPFTKEHRRWINNFTLFSS